MPTSSSRFLSPIPESSRVLVDLIVPGFTTQWAALGDTCDYELGLCIAFRISQEYYVYRHLRSNCEPGPVFYYVMVHVAREAFLFRWRIETGIGDHHKPVHRK